MRRNGLKQLWLNLILHYSSLIYKLKSSLFFAGILRTFFTALLIVILEIALSVISLPFYFFVVPDEDNPTFGGDIKAYHLRRKLTLSILLGFFLFQVVGTVLGAMGFGYFYNFLIYG